MQFHKLLITLMCLAISQPLWANIIITPTAFLNNKACDNIEGQWLGSGTVKVYAGPLSTTCKYSGTGNLIRDIAPDSFNMDIFLHIESGMCLDNVRIILPGKCHNGNVELKTDDADLTGSLSQDGTSADLYGTVKVPIMGRKVQAAIEDMHLEKQ